LPHLPDHLTPVWSAFHWFINNKDKE
jgi:hypothetical protein